MFFSQTIKFQKFKSTKSFCSFPLNSPTPVSSRNFGTKTSTRRKLHEEDENEVPSVDLLEIEDNKLIEKKEKEKSNKIIWSLEGQVKNFVNKLKTEFNVTKKNDWYRISQSQIEEMGGGGLQAHGGLLYALKVAFPNEKWNEYHMKNRSKKSSQRWLIICVQKLLLKYKILEDYENSNLIHKTGWNVQFDVFLPDLNLAIEYNGQHHYEELPTFGPFELMKDRDEEKKRICKENNIILVPIPYWWNRSYQSFEQTIYSILPFLHPLFIQPKYQFNFYEVTNKLLQNKEENFITYKQLFENNNKDKITNIIDISQRIPNENAIVVEPKKIKGTNISFMLAKHWDRTIDPTGFWISEKFDGQRVCWDGKKLYSRTGVEVRCPVWFKKYLPVNLCLDGELWGGYNNHDSLRATRVDATNQMVWSNLKMMVFDIPALGELVFEERLKIMEKIKQNKHLQVIKHYKCKGYDHLQSELLNITNKGGEGIVLVEPNSLYQPGRSDSFLKVKFLHDCEVRLKCYSHKAVGFIVELPNFEEVFVRSSYYEHLHPPPIGTIFTVAHYGLQKSGKLKHPFVLKIRKDLCWDDVVQQYNAK